MHIQKYIFPLILTLTLCIPTYAVEGEEVAAETPVEETVVEETPVEEPAAESTPEASPDEPTPEEVVEDETTPTENSDYSGDYSGGDSGSYSGDDSGLLDDLSLVGVEVYGLSPVTPSDTTGLKSVLLEFIGEYDPVIVEYEYQNSNNNYSSFLREVQPDYVWLASCGMLALFVLSLFKLGGAILCRR